MTVQSKTKALNPTSEFLEFLIEEFEGECRMALRLIEQLKKTDPESELHEDLEGDLFASLSRFTWLPKDILREWDKMIMALPE